MSEERIGELERAVTEIQVSLPSLMKEMKESTETQKDLTKSNIELSHDIRSLLKTSEEVNGQLSNHEGRIVELETKDRIRQSGEEVVAWVKRAIVVASVGVVFSGIVFVVKMMPQ
jgi:chromosome segregation ATPase